LAAAAAIDTWIASLNGIDYFQVDLYEIDESNLPAVTYKYAVTDIYSGPNDPALSHWTLGLELCANSLLNPSSNSYTTPIDSAVCGAGGDYANCVSTNYTVVTGNDPTTGVDGVKFEDAAQQLSFGQTHLFHITVSGETDRGEIPVAIKAAGNEPDGTITGPICTPTAVTMAAPNVASSNSSAFIAVAAAMMFMGVASAGVLRKK
jgi:hypothetical protein